MPEESKTKVVVRGGLFYKIDVNATSIPEDAVGVSAADIANLGVDLEGSKTDRADAPRTNNDPDDDRTDEERLAAYVPDEENTNTANTKAWYKHELLRHQRDFGTADNLEALQKAFQDFVLGVNEDDDQD